MTNLVIVLVLAFTNLPSMWWANRYPPEKKILGLIVLLCRPRMISGVGPSFDYVFCYSGNIKVLVL